MDDAEFDDLCRMAALRVDASERENLKAELGRILEFFARMEEAGFEKAHPLLRPVDRAARLREDRPAETDPDRWLALLPKRRERFVVVPRVKE